MDKAELGKVFRRLDRMDDRVRSIIARRKPLELDQSPRKKPQPKVTIVPRNDYGFRPAIGAGQLSGNEMRLPKYEPPACRDDAPGFDYLRDVIFAGFTREALEKGKHARKT